MQIKADNIGKQINIKAYLEESQQHHPILTAVVWECMSCLRLHEVTQIHPYEIRQPAVCAECGGKSFKIFKDESQFTDFQEVSCHVEDRFIKVHLRGCQCKSGGYEKGIYTIKGRLNVDLTKTPYEYYIDQVIEIRKNRK